MASGLCIAGHPGRGSNLPFGLLSHTSSWHRLPRTTDAGVLPALPAQELEETQDYLMEQFRKARTLEQKLKLSNALASNCRALFQGYRVMLVMEGGGSPMEKAYNQLKALEFDED